MTERQSGAEPLPSDLLQERVRHVELEGQPSGERQALAARPDQPLSLDSQSLTPPPTFQVDPPPLIRSVQYLFRDLQSIHLLIWTIVGCCLAAAFILPLLIRVIPLVVRLFFAEPLPLFLILVALAMFLVYRRRRASRNR